MQQTEEVRQIPVTVRKPIRERVNYQIPVKTLRWERQEMVRKIPVTTRRVEYEERVEQVPVRVCRMATEVRKVQKPRTVATWKAYQSTQCVPRTVVMRVPVDSYYSYELPTTDTYYFPAETRIAPLPAETTTQKPVTDPEGEEDGKKSVVKKEEEEPAEPEPESTPAEPGAEAGDAEPKDSDPMPDPALEPAELEDRLPPLPEETEETDQPEGEMSA
jgi:hypothetical protein